MKTLDMKRGMYRFSGSLHGLHLASGEFGFRVTGVSKDGNDAKGQGETEPSGKWTRGASHGFLGLASLAARDVDAD